MAVRHNKHGSAGLFLAVRLSQTRENPARENAGRENSAYEDLRPWSRRVNYSALNHDAVTAAGRRNPLWHWAVVLPVGVIGVGGFSCA